MNVELEVIDNVVQPKYVDGLKNGKYMAKVTNIDLRTISQSNSMWMWFDQIANKLNRENITITQVLKPETIWNKDKIKVNFFDPIMFHLYQKTTSTKLNKDEYTQIIDLMIKSFGMRGFELPPFPTLEGKQNGQ